MGFLDHSTNNIIIDAVLTDLGRRKLSAGNLSNDFVVSYAFADDEVDYTIIKKYGTIVGKEKIEKNTPVFEASTNAEFGVQYYLSTSSNPIVAQPTVSTTVSHTTLSSTNLRTTLTISLTDTQNILANVNYSVTYDSRYVVPVGNYQPKEVPNQTNRRFILVESSNKEDRTIQFSRAAAGVDILKQMATVVDQTNTQIKIEANNGITNSVTVIVNYS